jgi:hypothetical protein
MTDYDDAGMVEPFGPDYVRPAPAACSNCTCCTRALCELGRATTSACAGKVGDQDRALVAGCPCSSETAHGSLAWRAVRVRAVTAATERPLPEPLETFLKAAAAGEEVSDPEGLRILQARRYLDAGPAGPRLTEFGRLYLLARTEARQATPVIVHDVDVRARTARVVIVGRTADRLVTVPMDILANGHTGLAPAQLPGSTLHAHANCAAVHDDDVVLTQIRNPALPVGSYRRALFSAGARAARQAPGGAL